MPAFRDEAYRALTEGEVALARSMFGDAVEYGAARIAARKWWPLQPRQVAMAPRGCIHFHPGGTLYRDDYSYAELGLQALFVHEMTHVWQHQAGINLIVKRHPFCRYDYAIKPGQRFERYGIEQQAQIVQHAFLLRGGHEVAGAPALGVYDSILPFGQHGRGRE